MLLYRLAKEKYIHDLSRTGARLFGGRWNKKGTPVLYTSEHCSLALLELLVHTPHTLLPVETSLLKLHIPDDLPITKVNEAHLPDHWNQYPAPDMLGKIGTRWAQKGQNVGLRVPSVLVPDEWNILLNPHHQAFDGVKIASVERFSMDGRF